MSDSLLSESPSEPVESSRKNPLKMVFLSLSFLGLILFFTLLKLPQAKVTDYIQGSIQSKLDPMGIYISSRDRSLRWFPKMEYKLDHPVIELSEQTRIELDDLSLSPSLLRVFTGKLGVNVLAHQAKGELALDGAIGKSSLSMTTSLTSLDLAKIGLFSFAGIKGAGGLSGKIDLSGAPTDFTAMTGSIDLRLKSIALEEQSIFGLKIPSILMTDGAISGELKGGRLNLRSIVLGRQTDDLFLSASGDLILNRNLNSSQVNLRVSIGLSEKVKSALSFIDMMLSGAKQKDGKYAFKLTGPIAQPTMVPETAN